MAITNINKDNFESEVIKSNIPVLLDFSAEWCGPCKMLTPVLEEISEELKERVKICAVDVDSETDLASQYQVSSIPYMVYFKNGEVVDKQVGLTGKNVIKEKLSSLV